ncbi:MAG TPA: hypothetical protein VF278_21300 [Pirellulales bacterium]
MRTIEPRTEPADYAQWRAASRGDINYGYDLIPTDLRLRLKAALIAEQGGICAYTGIGINNAHSHIEHLIPQSHCAPGEVDVAYNNMVACFPGREDRYVPFGALKKANWPSPEEQHLFVSPRSAGCEGRFQFSIRGVISVNADDAAARVTAERLGLNARRLEALRREAIDATLNWHGRSPALLDLPSARKRLAALEHAGRQGGQLEPFCFVLTQALRKHIARLEYIRESKKRGGR